jgi:DNA-binding XRE family transcriptional regulator
MTLHNITKTFLKLCKTQCFDDGNKRTSLIFANALLLKHNLPLIRIVNNPLFKVRLVEYYDDDANIDSLIEYLITSSRQENIPTENELILTINAYLNKSGLTKYQLSKQTGVDRSYLTKIFNGKREPSVVVAKKLGSVLNFN